MTPSVGICVIATGRYIDFVAPLIASAQERLLCDCAVLWHIFTDADGQPEHPSVTYHFTPHSVWPGPTLHRHQTLLRAKNDLRRHTHLLMLDADMLIVGDVARECLPADGGLTATLHPGYVDTPPSRCPFERRTTSTACVPYSYQGRYYCGGVQGGATEKYLEACASITANIQRDSDGVVVAAWHDESHWNAWLALHEPPEIVLSSDYCTPQWQRLDRPGARILALDKDHAFYRTAPR